MTDSLLLLSFEERLIRGETQAIAGMIRCRRAEPQRRIRAVERGTWRSIGPWAVVFFYLAIAFEVIVMITPFTVYFYSVYAPVLNRLEASPWTAWLTAFFLPHISYTGDGLLSALAYLGPTLFGLGMAVFFVCAYQVYSAKLLRRGVVSGGL